MQPSETTDQVKAVRQSKIYRSLPWIGLVVWLLAGSVLVVMPSVFSYLETASKLRALIERGQTTPGVFVKELDHGAIAYRFTVKGRVYGTSGPSPDGWSYTIVKPFVVYYDPKDLSNNMLQDPHEAQKTLGSSITTAGVWVLLILGFFVWQLCRMVREAMEKSLFA